MFMFSQPPLKSKATSYLYIYENERIFYAVEFVKIIMMFGPIVTKIFFQLNKSCAMLEHILCSRCAITSCSSFSGLLLKSS